MLIAQLSVLFMVNVFEFAKKNVEIPTRCVPPSDCVELEV